MFRVDEPTEDLREQNRPDDERDGAQALNRALKLALLALAHTMRHQSLRGGEGNIPHRDHWYGGEKSRAVARESSNTHSERATKLAGAERNFFAKAFHHSSG